MATYPAWVTHVIYGDTIEVKVSKLTRRIKLYNIDAPEPEIRTHDAVESINYLIDLIGNQEVIIVERGTDRDDRPIADILRCSDNLHVNQRMVDAGHARWSN